MKTKMREAAEIKFWLCARMAALSHKSHTHNQNAPFSSNACLTLKKTHPRFQLLRLHNHHHSTNTIEEIL